MTERVYNINIMLDQCTTMDDQCTTIDDQCTTMDTQRTKQATLRRSERNYFFNWKSKNKKVEKSEEKRFREIERQRLSKRKLRFTRRRTWADAQKPPETSPTKQRKFGPLGEAKGKLTWPRVRPCLRCWRTRCYRTSCLTTPNRTPGRLAWSKPTPAGLGSGCTGLPKDEQGAIIAFVNLPICPVQRV